MTDDAPRLEPGYQRGDNVLHLTRGLLKETAICGHWPVDMIGVPDDAVPCTVCDDLSVEMGAKAEDSVWVKAVEEQAKR